MRLRRLLSPVPIVLAGMVLPAMAQAQEARGPPCAERGQTIEHLRTLFGERVIGSGLASDGVVVEIYAGTSGSWTLLITTPQGNSCLVASGEAWEPVPDPDLFARR